MNTVYAWGYGDLLVKVLQGVATLFDPSAGLLITLAKIVVLLGFIAVLLSYFSDYGQKDPLRVVKFYVLVIGVWAVFMNVKTTVQVQDLQLQRVDVVQNVPVAIAKPLAFFSQVQKSLAGLVDTAFGTPDTCRYSTSGFIGCYLPVSSALGMRITDPYLLLSFNEFVQNCVLTNVYDGTVDLNTMMTSDNLLYWLGYNLHPARFTKVYANSECDYGSSSGCSPCKGGYSCTCPDAWANIQGRIGQYANDDALKALSAGTGLAVNAISNALGTAPPFLLGIQQTGTALLTQTIVINQTYDALRSLAPGVEVAVGTGQRQAEQMGIANAILGSKYLPVVRGLITIIVVAFFPALFIFLFTPLAKQFLVGYITLFTWLTLWVFGEAVVHNLFMAKLSSMSQNIVSQGLKPVSMIYLPSLQGQAMDYLAMIGNYYWLVPTLAFVAATGFSIYGFKAMATGATAQAVAGAGGEVAKLVATGSYSAGQVSWDNLTAGSRSLGNTSIGNTSFLNYSGLTSSVDRYQAGHTETLGDYTRIQGGTLGGNLSRVMGNVKDATPYMVAMGLLGADARVSQMDIKNGDITSMKAVGDINGQRATLDWDGSKFTLTVGNTPFVFSKDSKSGQFVLESDVAKGLGMTIGEAQSRSLQEKLSQAQQISKDLSQATSYEQVASILQRNAEFFEAGIQKQFGRIFSSQNTYTQNALRDYINSENFKQALEKSQGFQEERQLGWGEVAQKGVKVNFGVGTGGGIPFIKGGIQAEDAVLNTQEGKLYVKGSDGKVYSLSLTEDMKRGLSNSYLKSLTTSSGLSGSDMHYGTKGTRVENSSSLDTKSAMQEVFRLSQAIQEGYTQEYATLTQQRAELARSGIVQWWNAKMDYYRGQGLSEEQAIKRVVSDWYDLKTRIDRGDLSAIQELTNFGSNQLSLKPPENLADVKERTSKVPEKVNEGQQRLENTRQNLLEQFGQLQWKREKKAKAMPNPAQAFNSGLAKGVEKQTSPAYSLPTDINLQLNNWRAWAEAQRQQLSAENQAVKKGVDQIRKESILEGPERPASEPFSYGWHLLSKWAGWDRPWEERRQELDERLRRQFGGKK
ncbi:MAG: conjugal transfer protein TraG N-terminal domain-containing protein [Aquificaceae bacterium]